MAKETIYTNIRLKKTTVAKLKILKAKREDLSYEDTMDYLLSKENLEFKK
ncbi:MAG: hypothetical protein PHD04_03385 [Candidatus Pacebacteria bacterium]|nr:hypothetical protein [Candidatus Paceibacterota bacterium]